ncbi:hypothetical protein ACFVSN_06035 [Kitasatospora sp. NPDC057904]|uniref:hypothetical protein n=1 Tax=unclassified Kitasatospora TaxID=2633591 RepID=UPI0036D9B346
MKARTPNPEQEGEVSDSKRFLFGGRLRYDYSFDDHEQTMLTVGFLTVTTRSARSRCPMSAGPGTVRSRSRPRREHDD